MNSDIKAVIDKLKSIEEISEDEFSDLVYKMALLNKSWAASDIASVMGALEAGIRRSAASRRKASLIYTLRQLNPQRAAELCFEIVEDVVREQKAVGALLFQVIDSIALHRSEASSTAGLTSIEGNLALAESVLKEHGIFVPW